MMMVWLRASAFLLLGVLLARKVCALAGGWLTYLLLIRPHLKTQPNSTNGSDVLNKQKLHKKQKLQVILCGFPKTGTMSLMQALEILGFPCFHGAHLVKPTNASLFLKAFTTGNPKCWEKLLDGYVAIADFPATCAYKQLMEIFPSAKIILNIRDPNKWYDSFSQMVRLTNSREHAVFRFITTCATKCIKTALYNPLFKGKPEDREVCLKTYLQHTYEIKHYVASHNLLIYNIEEEEGWSKLCNFLNVPILEVAFPNTNNRKQFRALVAKSARMYTIVLSLYIAMVSCTLVYLLY